MTDKEKEAYYGCSSYDTTIDYVEKVLYRAEWDNNGFCLIRKNTTVVKVIAETEGHIRKIVVRYYLEDFTMDARCLMRRKMIMNKARRILPKL